MKSLWKYKPRVSGLIGMVQTLWGTSEMHTDRLRPDGAKLKVVLSKDGTIEITGNEFGLKALSQICASLAETVGQAGNHYHFMDVPGFWGTEAGSIPLVIYGEDL